ncbi:hypothetical protein [Mycolicibacterium sp.]|uniref:hypothetical protein n=1 Tax=Mycolicibacterium sp. TaxID=2320850 RepID=UPI001A33D03E|nr:hypothetical protein [Mycolicibacterium sp.]MBJ7341499.1 hypothetical protein [Mycolicibacterium sp.]
MSALARGRRSTTVPRVCAALALSALVATACGNALTGDVELPSYGPVSSPPQPAPGTAALPAAFPRDVPVPPGRYRVGPGPVDKSLSLTVTDAAPGALERAVRLLRDGGYQVEPVMGRDMYLGPRYVVTVSADSEHADRLDYTVMDTRAIPGLPQMPRLDIPTLIPAVG